jgi:ketosteroid isomerase-like protein
MSRENVEVMRRGAEAFNRRDKDAWLSLNDPDVEFRAPSEWPESETVCGREAVWDFMLSLNDAWEQGDYEMVETIDAGTDKLAARFRRPVQGKASGIADVFDYWCVSTFRRGKIRRSDWFANRAEALEAVGLRE